MRAQAAIDKAWNVLTVERGVLIMPGVYKVILDAAIKAAYDAAQHEIDEARKVMLTHQEIEALARYLRVHGDLDKNNAVALTSIYLDGKANARRFWDVGKS
jgi:hypothetical protein